MSNDAKQGKIKFFNESKGFGFIIPDGDGDEIFFHTTKVRGEIKGRDEGKAVTYNEQEGKKGVEACNVELA